MKQIIFRPLVLSFVLSVSISFNVFTASATTQFGKVCPQRFIATVINVEDVAGGPFPKVEVNFQMIQTLKGDPFVTKKMQIIKNGPLQFKTGAVYTVESRESWLCSANLFSKI